MALRRNSQARRNTNSDSEINFLKQIGGSRPWLLIDNCEEGDVTLPHEDAMWSERNIVVRNKGGGHINFTNDKRQGVGHLNRVKDNRQGGVGHLNHVNNNGRGVRHLNHVNDDGRGVRHLDHVNDDRQGIGHLNHVNDSRQRVRHLNHVKNDRSGSGNFAVASNRQVSRVNEVMPQTVFECAYCGTKFQSKDQREAHYTAYPNFCRDHRRCFTSWNTHLDRHSHRFCPFPSCVKRDVDHGTDAAFMRHFNASHTYVHSRQVIWEL
ncbi:hypothetical protein MMC12_006946 [Toensbergia leucococca]|nr:hypothetical protein [Toensbergia leucococca]